VGNVPDDMKPATLTRFFFFFSSNYGDIEEGPGGFDRNTGKSKGYSLILYRTIEAANQALEDPVKSIDGHQLFL
jgi:heterogeneous nuclear ribonucleoprotein A1/A3